MAKHSNKIFRAERLLLGESKNGSSSPFAKGTRQGTRQGADQGVGQRAGLDPANSERHQEIIENINALREEVRGISSKQGGLASEIKQQIEDANALKLEIQTLHSAINHTKEEIAAVRHPGSPDSDRLTSAAGQLEVIVGATEEAAHNILEAVEKIDEICNHIRSSSKDDHITAQLDEVAEQIVNIFEACNFQDLTGQRINKIIKTMQFIEDRIQGMIGIWGEDDFAGIPVPEKETAEGDDPEMHGPSDDGVSQADIDALFD